MIEYWRLSSTQRPCGALSNKIVTGVVFITNSIEWQDRAQQLFAPKQHPLTVTTHLPTESPNELTTAPLQTFAQPHPRCSNESDQATTTLFPRALNS